MTSTKQTTKKFWMKGRLALACAASLCAVAVASSCTSTDTARDGTSGAANNTKGKSRS